MHGTFRTQKILKIVGYACDRFFRLKIHHMVAKIYSALKFASMQNLFETCKENCSSGLLNLIELATDSPWTNFYIYIHSVNQLESKKFGAGTTGGSLLSPSWIFAREMSFVFASVHLTILFHVLPVVKIPFWSFCRIFILLLNSSFCKCTAYISFNTFKTIFLHYLLLLINVFFPLLDPPFMRQFFWNVYASV